jgi:hypothetical protein
MRNILVISFGVLILLSVVVWLVGILAGVVVPLFGGISAERLGAIGFTVGMAGEGCAYLFGWLRGSITRKDAQQFSGFSGPKKYGNKNDVV